MMVDDWYVEMMDMSCMSYAGLGCAFGAFCIAWWCVRVVWV